MGVDTQKGLQCWIQYIIWGRDVRVGLRRCDGPAGRCSLTQRFQQQFEDLGRIGTGGFSTVSKVSNKRDRKLYALKIVKIKPSEFKEEVSDYLEKILGEAKVLSALRHPNILQYHGCWVEAKLKTEEDLLREQESDHEEEEELQLVMEEYSQNSCGFEFEQTASSAQKNIPQKKQKNVPSYKENPTNNIYGVDLNTFKQINMYLLSELGEYSLQKHVYLRNQQSRKTENQKKEIRIQNYKIILQIIEGLMYIHSQKVIHRDIKLQNIIINKDKKCKIIDFGLAKKVRNLKSLTIQKLDHKEDINDKCEEKHSSSVGTKIFSSPEQTNSNNYDHRTDIYSLAMVIGVLFSHYKTSHEENQLLLNLRNKKLDDFTIDEKLKALLAKSLSEQKCRPELKQIQNCVKKLLKQQLQNIQSQNENNNRQINLSKKIKTPRSILTQSEDDQGNKTVNQSSV